MPDRGPGSLAEQWQDELKEKFELQFEMLTSDLINATAGDLPDLLTADAGYWSEAYAKTCAEQWIDAYIATGRLPHSQPLPPKRSPMPKAADVKARIARKV